MKKILLLLICAVALSFVSCGNKAVETKKGGQMPEPKTYLVKVLKTYVDSLPETSFEKVDVIVNDTIRHKEIMRINTVYSFAVEYKYCIEGDTVWHRVMTGVNKDDYEQLKKYKLNESDAYDFIAEEDDRCDIALKVSSSIRQMSRKYENRDFNVSFDNEIDSLNPIIDLETKEIWDDAVQMVKEHNKKQ